MIRIYVRRINSGLMNINEVPERWKAGTEEALNVS